LDIGTERKIQSPLLGDNKGIRQQSGLPAKKKDMTSKGVMRAGMVVKKILDHVSQSKDLGGNQRSGETS
jgi:hypothetical protein